MNFRSLFFLFLAGFFFLFQSLKAQILPNFAIAGGPSSGWHFTNVDRLNKEPKEAGFPELSTSGFLTLGGGGFIELSLKDKNNYIRIGGFGTGFNTKKVMKANDTLTKAVNFDFGMGGVSVEYVRSFGNFDIFGGLTFSTGVLRLDLYQYRSNSSHYKEIWNEFINNYTSGNITRNFSTRFYAVQPQIGVGLLLKKFLYLKFNTGYLLATGGTWKVDNNVEVTNFPTDIRSNGFNLNFGINIGLFIRD